MLGTDSKLVHCRLLIKPVLSSDGWLSGPAIQIWPGHPLTGEIYLQLDYMWHGGSDFHELQKPFWTKSDATA